MSNSSSISFADAQATITTNEVIAHAAEIHGMLTGLICAGFAFESHDYLALVNDCFNNNEMMPMPVKSLVKDLYSGIWQGLSDDAFGFQPLLPDDDDSIVERTAGLAAWVQGFNLGFGLQHKDSPVSSEEAKEVLADFAEIANLSDDVDEDEDCEQAYFEIAEYVRISSLLIFSELGTLPEQKTESKTLH